MDNEAVLKMINKRIDEVHNRIDNLAESYKVLNDSHSALENNYIEMNAEWKTLKTLAKYIFGANIFVFIIGLLNVLKLFGVI